MWEINNMLIPHVKSFKLAKLKKKKKTRKKISFVTVLSVDGIAKQLQIFENKFLMKDIIYQFSLVKHS